MQAIADRGLELLSTTFIFSFLATLALYVVGCKSRDRSSSLKPHVSGNLIHDWWFGIQLNPQFMGIDLKFFFVRAGMMGWLLINLSVLAKCIQEGNLNRSMVLYQLFCALYIIDYFFYEEFMTSTWDIIAERLGFMLVFGDLVWIPFTFSIQVYKIKWCFSYLKSSLSVFIISYNKIISFIIFSFQVDGFWHSKSGQCIPYETIFTLFDMPQQTHQPFSNLWMTNIHSWSSSSWLCTIESHLLKKIYIG
nr:delta(14)-sterol reductase [Ipomoea batatas]GMC88967.1 delta(14)-sterol reductase [Ipomoea batatas]